MSEIQRGWLFNGGGEEVMDISNKASDADYIREVEKTIDNIRLSVTETQDEFIFQTIDEFIRSNFYMVIDKELLD